MSGEKFSSRRFLKALLEKALLEKAQLEKVLLEKTLKEKPSEGSLRESQRDGLFRKGSAKAQRRLTEKLEQALPARLSLRRFDKKRSQKVSD